MSRSTNYYSSLPDSILDALHHAATRVKNRSDELVYFAGLRGRRDPDGPPPPNQTHEAFLEDILNEVEGSIKEALKEAYGEGLVDGEAYDGDSHS